MRRGRVSLVAAMLLGLALVAPSTVAASTGFTPSTLSITRNGGVLTASPSSFTGDLASALSFDWLPSDGYVRVSVATPAGGLLCLSPVGPCPSAGFVGSNPASGSTLDLYFNEAATFTLDVQAVDPTIGGYFPAPGIDPVTVTVVVRSGATAPPPTIAIASPADGATYTLGQTVVADYSCAADAGLASCIGPVPSGSAIDTSTIGDHAFTVTATDALDQTAATTVAYHVGYGFGGFLAPASGTARSATAGSSIPIRWRLTRSDGSPITNLDPAGVSVTILTSPCDLGSTPDLPFADAGSSTLQSLGDGYYRLVWKTSRTYVGSCKTLSLDVGDGATHELEVDFVR